MCNNRFSKRVISYISNWRKSILGSKLVKKFLKDNHRVTVVDNMTYNNYDTIPKNENFEFVDDDIVNIKKHIDSIPTIERIFYLVFTEIM